MLRQNEVEDCVNVDTCGQTSRRLLELIGRSVMVVNVSDVLSHS